MVAAVNSEAGVRLEAAEAVLAMLPPPAQSHKRRKCHRQHKRLAPLCLLLQSLPLLPLAAKGEEEYERWRSAMSGR